MNQVIRSIRSNPIQLGRKTCSGLRLRPVTTMSGKQNQNEQNQKDKTGDVMSHSFGEGYATRSDEEGFGGTGGGNNQDVRLKLTRKFMRITRPMTRHREVR